MLHDSSLSILLLFGEGSEAAQGVKVFNGQGPRPFLEAKVR